MHCRHPASAHGSRRLRTTAAAPPCHFPGGEGQPELPLQQPPCGVRLLRVWGADQAVGVGPTRRTAEDHQGHDSNG